MINLLGAYNNLSQYFGPQHWWPVTPKGKLCPEYSGGPRNDKQKLEVCFGAILTQNTSWKNVEKAIIELNKNSLIDVNKINKIENKKLARIIKSSGYHNQKAKKLKNFCSFLLNSYDGKLSLLFRNGIEKLRNELLSVNGIGPETADSIILYAAKKPVFVIDAYTKRIMGRIGYREQTYESLQELFMQKLQNSEKLFNECHALLVELGKNICKKSPLCEECPLSNHCGYFKMLTSKESDLAKWR
ncbi:endonuclease III domain-containing protein [Candidatus Woesearchaeota archaeon]|nr:endonuclease III domain-containing protein [Candidatus Woesearchaeota archaeon]